MLFWISNFIKMLLLKYYAIAVIPAPVAVIPPPLQLFQPPLQLIRLTLQLIPIRLALLTLQLFQFRPQLYLSLCASFVIITRSTQCACRVATHCAMSVRLTWIDGCKIQLIILKEESRIVFFVVNMLFKLC